MKRRETEETSPLRSPDLFFCLQTTQCCATLGSRIWRWPSRWITPRCTAWPTTARPPPRPRRSRRRRCRRCRRRCCWPPRRPLPAGTSPSPRPSSRPTRDRPTKGVSLDSRPSACEATRNGDIELEFSWMWTGCSQRRASWVLPRPRHPIRHGRFSSFLWPARVNLKVTSCKGESSLNRSTERERRRSSLDQMDADNRRA